ncbi:MAG: SDR family oxidoreductase, partial [Acidobacteria bacterium]|nr:SDR family oxidoreductase [Acidobacteriota bacterium]
ASKWAVIGIVQALAMELAPYKINVNAINPGFFATNLRDSEAIRQSREKGISVEQFREEEYKMLANMVPLKRMGRLEDIADVTYFLVSEQSQYLTGVNINVTGGTLMH